MRRNGLALVALAMGISAGLLPWVSRPAAAVFDCARVIDSVNLPDGTQVAAGQHFIKRWRLHNCGDNNWQGYRVLRISGDFGPESFFVSQWRPGTYGELTIQGDAPLVSGRRLAEYQLSGPRGRFGDTFWVELVVATPAGTNEPIPPMSPAAAIAAGGAADRAAQQGAGPFEQGMAARNTYLAAHPDGTYHANMTFVHSYTAALYRQRIGPFEGSPSQWYTALAHGLVQEGINGLDQLLGGPGHSGLTPSMVTRPGPVE